MWVAVLDEYVRLGILYLKESEIIDKKLKDLRGKEEDQRRLALLRDMRLQLRKTGEKLIKRGRCAHESVVAVFPRIANF
jgi:23S rRNA maturation mini-RNase III